jgi:osomolarity two-component system sensor histidine kinase NIK1
MTMEQIPFSLRLAVFSVLKTLCVKASQNKLDLIFDIDPSTPDQLIGDPLRLRQVITNLIGNAVKFTSRGQVALSCRVKNNDDKSVDIEFCVADTGIGIEPDKLDVIFDTFAQADGSTTRKYGGTGLGLTISKRLVNLMTGNLWVESEYGQGSRFYFTTTAEKRTPTDEQTIERLAPWLGHYILYIDTLKDETGVVDMLIKLGLKPVVVGSVEEVITNQKTAPAVDTMIVDSLSAAEKLRAVEHLRAIPIVLLAPVSQSRWTSQWTKLTRTEQSARRTAQPILRRPPSLPSETPQSPGCRRADALPHPRQRMPRNGYQHLLHYPSLPRRAVKRDRTSA